MSDPNPEFNESPLSAEEKHAARFAQMVLQSTSMAMMFMGQAPNPVSGKIETDLDASRMFIDQLEMLEVKTRGNLTKQEQHLLSQNMMAVRMAFVQAVADSARKPEVGDTPVKAAGADNASQPVEPDDGSKRRFTKSYGAS